MSHDPGDENDHRHHPNRRRVALAMPTNHDNRSMIPVYRFPLVDTVCRVDEQTGRYHIAPRRGPALSPNGRHHETPIAPRRPDNGGRLVLKVEAVLFALGLLLIVLIILMTPARGVLPS